MQCASHHHLPAHRRRRRNRPLAAARATASLLGLACVTLGGGGNLGHLMSLSNSLIPIPLPGPAAAAAQIDHYQPFQDVDLANYIEAEVGGSFELSRGEAMDVNDDGFACGWYFDSNSNSQPFVFSPVDGGSAEVLPLDPGWFRGHATAISETGDAQPSIKMVLEFGPKGDSDHDE